MSNSTQCLWSVVRWQCFFIKHLENKIADLLLSKILWELSSGLPQNSWLTMSIFDAVLFLILLLLLFSDDRCNDGDDIAV